MRTKDVKPGVWVKLGVTIRGQGPPLAKGAVVKVTSGIIHGPNGDQFKVKTGSSREYRVFLGQAEKVY